MKAYTSEELRGVVQAIRNRKYNERLIHGPRFVAIEIGLFACGRVFTTQGLAKTHWRDKHDPGLGETIARGRAEKAMARWLARHTGSAETAILELEDVVAEKEIEAITAIKPEALYFIQESPQLDSEKEENRERAGA